MKTKGVRLHDAMDIRLEEFDEGRYRLDLCFHL